MSTPAKAADFGGDCCADLEERVAELEATTVRKGNKKVSVTLSGWVVKSVNWWDDGSLDDAWVGDKDADLTSRFALTGSATIAPGWSGGYNITVTVPGNWAQNLFSSDVFGIFSSQFGQDSPALGSINTLYSYIYVKSDKYGTLNWGYLSPASDNAAVLADLSGTVIESNAVYFEGGGFFLRPKGSVSGFPGLSGVTWGAFLTCSLVGPIGADCYGAPQSGVRYDSPTFGGFRLETSWSNDYDNNRFGTPLAAAPEVFDVAIFYNGDWGNWKASAAGSYTNANGNLFSTNPRGSVDIFQAGATVMHTPSGIGVYGYYQNEDVGGNYLNVVTGTLAGVPSSDTWYVKPFIKRTWNPLGATVLYGEYGNYKDAFSSVAGLGQCGTLGLAGTNIGAFCAANPLGSNVYVTGSEMERWGLGAVQEIDSAAMHLFARWQHQDADVDFVGFNPVTGQSRNIGQGFEDWDLFQVGGIIFF